MVCPSLLHHGLLELSALTCLSWVVHSFIELYKPLCHNKAMIYEVPVLCWVTRLWVQALSWEITLDKNLQSHSSLTRD